MLSGARAAVRGPRVIAVGCVDSGSARGFNGTLYVKVSTDGVAAAAAARARCQTNFAGSMAASRFTMLCVCACFLYSALAPTLILLQCGAKRCAGRARLLP